MVERSLASLASFFQVHRDSRSGRTKPMGQPWGSLASLMLSDLDIFFVERGRKMGPTGGMRLVGAGAIVSAPGAMSALWGPAGTTEESSTGNCVTT